MKNRKGFTLVEIVAAIAIMAIIGLIAAPAVIKKFNSSRIQAMVIQENKLVEAGDILLDDYCKDALDDDKKRKCKFYYQDLALSDDDRHNYSEIIKDDKKYKYICVSDIKELDYYSEELVYSGTPCQGVVIYEIDKKSNMTSDSFSYVKCEDAYKTQDKNVKIEELFKGCFDGSNATNREQTYTVTVKHVENDLGGMEISPRKTHTVRESKLIDDKDDVLFEIETILHTRNGNTYKPVLKVGGENIKYKERKVNNKTVYDITGLPSKNLTINIVYTVEKHAIVSNFYRFVPGKDENEKSHNGVKMTGIGEQKINGYTFETMKVDFPETLDQTIGGKTEKYSLVEVWVEDSKKTLPFDGNVEVTQEDTFVDFVYQQDEFNVTYNNKGGTGCDKGRIKYNKKYKESTYCTPTKTGYTFSGWSLTDGGEVLDKEEKNLAYHDITLYAKYEPKTYTITYYMGKASSTVGVASIGTSTCKYNETCVLTDFAELDTPFPYSYQDEQATLNTTKHGNYGWSFAGWTTDKDATPNASNKFDINYSNKKSFTYNIASNLKLYAIGKRNMHFNGGVAPVKSYAEPVQYWNPYGTTSTYLTTVAIPNKVDISGWNFVGYKCGSSIADSEVTLASSLAGTKYKVPYNKYPYTRSVYKRTLTLKYDSNGGSGTTSNQTATQYYNSGYGNGTKNIGARVNSYEFTLSNNAFENPGYKFVNWKGKDDGKTYAAGSKYSFKPSVDASSTKWFLAQWDANSYKITYYLGNAGSTGGVTSIGTSSCKYNETCVLTDFAELDTPFPYSYQDEQATLNTTKHGNYGWSFAGWTTDKDATPNASNKFDINYSNKKSFTYNIASNLKLYAIGKRNMHFNGGVAPVKSYAEPVQYWNPYSTSNDYLTNVSIPNKTDITGWTFAGFRCGSSVADANVTLAANTANTSQKIAYNAWPYTRSVYKRTLSLEYKPNTGTGTMSNQTDTQYYNSGYGKNNTNYGANETNHTFTLAYNGFTKSGYEFVEWKEDSTSGTSRAAGSSFSFSPSVNKTNKKVFYAKWKQNNTLLNSYKCANISVGSEPYIMTYSGDCEVISDKNGNWKVKYLTTGDLIFTRGFQFDVFLVGGGGSGANYGIHSGGGGGGYTTSENGKTITANESYHISIGKGGIGGSTNGNSGDSTKAFGLTAAGGGGGGGGGYMVGPLKGGNGGSGGGAGSSPGHAEQSASTPGLGGTDGHGGKGSFTGTGQGTTTREFEETTGTLYAKGGDGAKSGGTMAAGGANTGNGGAGGGYNGGSGVVVIRPSKTNPYFTYTGNYEIVDNNGNQISDLNGDWKIRFLTEGKLIFKNFGSATNGFDVFLVGGGGGGASYGIHSGGGGGGYTTTKKQMSLLLNHEYDIFIGPGGSGGGTTAESGGETTAFGLSAAGGEGAGNGGYMVGPLKGGNGGSGGGAGSSPGHAEISPSTPGLGGTNGHGGRGSFPGTGQGTTTREFGESTGILYAEGGDGHSSGGNMRNGDVNTGNGGAGGSFSGGSGIVVIRPSKPNPYFSYTGTYEIVDDSGNKKSDLTGNWKIKFLSSGTLTFKNLGNASNGIDVFCVGGGGGTSFYGNHNGGGGGGYTKTKRNVSVEKSKKYEIIVGNGGSSGSTSGGNGGSSSAFGLSASGGQGGGNGGYMIGSLKGGNGGSGGGAGVAAGHAEQYSSTPGLGGTNGNDGAGSFPGTGQGSTTKEFGENSGKLYSKGGDGSTVSGGSFTHGGLNTGNGGAGGAYSGGSGIVIIRNKR